MKTVLSFIFLPVIMAVAAFIGTAGVYLVWDKKIPEEIMAIMIAIGALGGMALAIVKFIQKKKKLSQ